MKYLAIIFTFMSPHVVAMEHELKMKTQESCEEFIAVIRNAWIDAPDNFHYQLECKKNPNFGKS